MKKEIIIMNEVDSKYREFLETTPDLNFYLEGEKYYVKMDSHYDELGSWEDLIYFLDCQLLLQ